jgi:hypothetical protein
MTGFVVVSVIFFLPLIVIGLFLILSGKVPLLGLILVIVASYLFYSRLWKKRPRAITMDNSVVRVTERLPFVSSWEEQVSAFKRVDLRIDEASRRQWTESPGGGCTLYRAELVHPDPHKTVILCETPNKGDARKVWMDAANATNLPRSESTDSNLGGVIIIPKP